MCAQTAAQVTSSPIVRPVKYCCFSKRPPQTRSILSCSAHSSGTFQNENDHMLSTCKPCPTGQYQDATGQASCKDCAAGSYVTSGATTCTACVAGKASNKGNVVGEANCQACIGGKFQNLAGQTSCKDCGKGNQATDGAKQCANCPAGKYNDMLNTACKNCQVSQNRYQPNAGQQGCLTTATCSAGRRVSPVATATSNLSCVLCEKGGRRPRTAPKLVLMLRFQFSRTFTSRSISCPHPRPWTLTVQGNSGTPPPIASLRA
jgi:hypothetical protein